MVIFFVLSAFLAPQALPQIDRTANLALQLKPGILRQDAPPADETVIDADTQEVNGPIRKLRGHVRLERTEMVLYADEVDFNTEASYVEARGNVHYKNFLRHE